MFRNAVLALAAVAMLGAAVPAYAGPAETAFLQKLTNTWTGKGKLTGAENGPIACKMVLSAGKTNLRFQGRCNIPDLAQQAFSGSISYNDKLGRYESKSGNRVVPGVRKGDKLVFRTQSRTLAGTATSTMTISPSSLVVDFALVGKQGEKTTSRVIFER
jgi:hypothetical protein